MSESIHSQTQNQNQPNAPQTTPKVPPYGPGDVLLCNFPMPPKAAHYNPRVMESFKNNPEPAQYTHPVYIIDRHIDPKTNKDMLIVAYGTSQDPKSDSKRFIQLKGNFSTNLGFNGDQYFDAANIAYLPAEEKWFPYIKTEKRPYKRMPLAVRSAITTAAKREAQKEHSILFNASRSQSR